MTVFVPRRDWLKTAACGFGSMALSALCAQQAAAVSNPLGAKQPHHPPRAKRQIFLFMQGGVSHVDSYDYKPRLKTDDGKQMPFHDARSIANSGNKKESAQRVMKSLWDYRQYGECGRWASDLFPEMNQHVDKMCFVHSMRTEGIAHGPATLFLHCGSTAFIRPSMGAWLLYGLGSESDNLPGFVSIAPSIGNGGPRNYGNAFLPAVYQGTALGRAGGPAKDATIRNLSNASYSPTAQREQFELLRQINNEQLKQAPGDAELDAVVNSYELAWRMQMNAPEALDIAHESEATQKLYGIGDAKTDNFGRQCLMARRLCEAGVRYVQVTYGDNSANPAWDQHSNMPKHGDHAQAVDRPIAGLLTDLAERGLLEDTLVWWGGEFGRTPYAQGNGTGRDHNTTGFTIWLAGGGVKPGFAYGGTDEFGHHAVVDKVHMHDLHATMLHLLGLDHERLTFRSNGREFRLTDVHGHVVQDLIS